MLLAMKLKLNHAFSMRARWLPKKQIWLMGGEGGKKTKTKLGCYNGCGPPKGHNT